MSKENVEGVRQAFEQWQRAGGGVEAIPMELFAEDVEWDQSSYPLVDFPPKGVGRDNLFAAFARYFSDWTSQTEAKDFIDAGESVFCFVHEKAKIGASDVFVEREWFQVFTLRDGQVVKWLAFRTREEALEAAGLSE
jgi:ketosteroid isomerase-like protein